MNRKKHRKLLKNTAEAAVILLFLLLGGLWLIRSGPKAAPPMGEEPEVSRMYVASTNLAIDQDVLAEIENANISSDSAASEREPDENAGEEKEQDPENKEEQSAPEEEQKTDPEKQEDSSSQTNENYNSLSSLIQKLDPEAEKPKQEETGDPTGDPDGDNDNPGQGHEPSRGGSSQTLSPEESGALYYTSIIDGDIVTNPTYYFTITLTEKGKALELVSQTVTVNGASGAFRNGDGVTLKEGANTIKVMLRFRDKAKNQVDAPSRTYTVYYYPNNRYWLDVKNASSQEHIMDGETVYVSENVIYLDITAGRIVNDEARPATAQVRCNNAAVTQDASGLFQVPLRVGENAVTVSTGSNVNQLTMSFKVNYVQDSFILTFASKGADKKGNEIKTSVTTDRFNRQSSYTWASEDQEFSFLISCSSITGKEKIRKVTFTKNGSTSDITSRVDGAGYRTVTLEGYNQDAGNYRGNKIQVDFTDSYGNDASYIWTIVYERTGTDASHEPFFSVSVVDGQTANDSPIMVYVTGVDYLSNTLTNRHYTVTLNGREVEFSDIVNYVYYGYLLNLEEGPNTLVVTARDNDQYTKTETFRINYRDVEEVVYVNLMVEAEVLGLPVLLQETIPVSNKYTIARMVEERLAAYGYRTTHRGTVEDDEYYLSAIEGEGILNGWTLTEEQRNKYEDEGFIIQEPYSMNVLAEKDITLGAGWLVSRNNVYITTGMGVNKVRDGDTIHIRFTLDLGKDVE